MEAFAAIAPSAVTCTQDNQMTGKPYHVPDAMSQFDIAHVINGFVESAKGALAAGFDGIEIHCAHGYLHNQFLSSYSNKRTDKYGGALENRFRFVHETIQAVKSVMPPDRLLVARISNWGVADMEVSLFADQQEWQDLIGLFSREPLDAISVSTYDYSSPAFNTNKTMAQLTREVTDLPILICGRIYDRQSALAAIEDADIVLSGKTALLNPGWVDDIRQDKAMAAYESDDANIAYTDTPLP
jgi:2,4-dienoyl-CoA reductase-like NADH-dependent reductase (Old Yellow Enzyme family)